MKVKSIAANQTEIELKNGNIVFVSYETPVAYFESGLGVIKTAKKWSGTTSRHITQFCNRHNLTLVGEREQGFFDSLLEGVNA